MNRSARRTIRRLVTALVLPAAFGLGAAHASETTTLDCWSSAFDRDGDGYARSDARTDQRVRLELQGAHRTCPAPWVGVRGDCDDGDAAVHPRQFETRDNGVDDDCDGRADEPELWAAPDGYSVGDDRFSLFVRISDSTLPALFERGELYARVEYQDLRDTGDSHFAQYRPVGWLYDLPAFAYTLVELTGLTPGTVYRARVRFYRGAVTNGRMMYWPAGAYGDWHYQMTRGEGLVGDRADIVNAGLYEAWLDSKLGRVGYYGWEPNGTRYGADLAEAWCSEFYSYVLTPFVDGMGHRPWTSSIIDWYADFGLDITVPADRADEWMSTFARPGDYLALDTNDDGAINHSAMFLAYDDATGGLITLDGNTHGRVDIDGPEYKGGNAATVRRRGVDTLEVWGALDARMMR